MFEKLTERQIEAGAKWWAAALNDGHFDNGDRSLGSAFAGGLASILYRRANVTPEKIAAFERELDAILRAGVVEYQGREFHTRDILSTDYHPDMFLSTALARGEIHDDSGCVLPWKTVMWFKDGGVEVAAGYGARPQWILPPTRVRVGRDIYRPATRYWVRRSTRFAANADQERKREHLLSYADRCRVCNSIKEAWWHGTAARVEGRKEAHAYVEPTGSTRWRVRRSALRALRDGRENDFVRNVARSTWA